MKAVILAAGEGKRMYPLTTTRPKVMLPVANKPIMEHLLVEIREAGIQDFLVVVGHHGEKIRDYFRDGSAWGVSIKYVSQRKQRGTADAVRQVLPQVGPPLIVANGDIVVCRDDIRSLMEHIDTTMGLFFADNVSGLGVVEVEGSMVARIHEKPERPPTNIVNTGVYLLTGDAFPAINDTGLSPRGEFELTSSLQLLIERHVPVRGYMTRSWLNFTYPWDLLEANESLLARMDAVVQGDVEDGAVLKGPVSVGKNTTVRSGSYICGPVIIGDDCDIGPNCYIRPSTAIGDHCHIGAAVEVKNSIIMNGSNVPHHNYVGDAIIGERCNLGAGAKIANLRLDRGDIWSMGINTHRHKMGAMLGDGVQVGINASLNVGVAIGCNSVIGPGASVAGMVLPGSEIM
jgi:bifunctional UDP-N-acetylglucosamine pyrophosphorylase/glucosamine-1-phosphate N-acetyltransferase